MVVAPATHGLAAHGLVPYGLASTDPFYRFGEYLRENQDQVVEKATDPTYLIGGLFGLLLAAGLAAGVIVGILFLASRLLYRLQELTLPPGTITFGPRREHAYDYVVGPPVRQELKDSALHNEILGPRRPGQDDAHGAYGRGLHEVWHHGLCSRNLRRSRKAPRPPRPRAGQAYLTFLIPAI